MRVILGFSDRVHTSTRASLLHRRSTRDLQRSEAGAKSHQENTNLKDFYFNFINFLNGRTFLNLDRF